MSKTISVSKSNFSWPSRMDCDAELNKGSWIADLFAIATAGQARAMLLFIALLFSTVSAQSAATDFVRGSFGGAWAGGGSLQVSFTCSGTPTCIGRYTASLRNPGCSNSFPLSDSLVITGVDISRPGPIQILVALSNFDFNDINNSDGSCSVKAGTVRDRILTFNGTWTGTEANFGSTLATDMGVTIELNGSFKKDAIPTAFPMVVTGSITPTVANINAAIQYRPQDVGTTGSVYVFALAPASMVKNVSADALLNHKGPVARGITTTSAPLPCVLAQLTASGELTAATAGTLQSYLTGVLSAQGASVDVLKGVSTALVSGAVFYVGYGATSTAMINGGVHRNVVTVPGSNVCEPQAPQTGWWWNSAQDGRGFGIEVRGNTLFMSGYLYDDTGHATWVVAAGQAALDGSFFNNTIYHVSNGQSLTGPYKAPAPVTIDGTITLSFTNARNGTLIWPGGSIPIERLDTVLGAGNGITPAFVPENGWWWNEAESGRGFFMEFKNNFAFIAGYMYEPDGRPVWYTAQGTLTTPQTFSANWLQVANGQTLTGPYKKPTIINANVGAVAIAFADAENAILTLPNAVKVPIKRHRF